MTRNLENFGLSHAAHSSPTDNRDAELIRIQKKFRTSRMETAAPAADGKTFVASVHA
jgi:hypothetical protein